jgi:hypothetical protein
MNPSSVDIFLVISWKCMDSAMNMSRNEKLLDQSWLFSQTPVKETIREQRAMMGNELLRAY